ncbi:MAG TPA: hypothetical protein VD862_00500 [Candidatus Paceibacterota bacterium]|nr:hypothetical protein [Candidatus Paceibacterota bacterium]
MSEKQRTPVHLAQFLMLGGEGTLVLWLFEDALPLVGGRGEFLGANPFRSVNVQHGKGYQDCGGYFTKRDLSPESVCLLCEKCRLRLVVPRTVNTVARFYQWMESRSERRALFVSENDWNRFNKKLEDDWRMRTAATA